MDVFKLKGNYQQDFQNRLEIMSKALEKPIGIEGNFDQYNLDEVSEDFCKDSAMEFIQSLRTEQVTEELQKLSLEKNEKITIGRQKNKYKPKGSKKSEYHIDSLSFMDID